MLEGIKVDTHANQVVLLRKCTECSTLDTSTMCLSTPLKQFYKVASSPDYCCDTCCSQGMDTNYGYEESNATSFDDMEKCGCWECETDLYLAEPDKYK